MALSHGTASFDWPLATVAQLPAAAAAAATRHCRSMIHRPAIALFYTSNNPNTANKSCYEKKPIALFVKVRFFFYFALRGGALTSLFVSLVLVAAALNGIHAELLPQSAVNVGVDASGLLVLAFLYQNDLAWQESRLQRATTKGAALAKLTALKNGSSLPQLVPTESAKSSPKELKYDTALMDLLIIPYVLGGNLAGEENDLPNCIAHWKEIIDDEVAEATKQGVDCQSEGLFVSLKKNNRIGQRTKGINLGNMVAGVTPRAAMGMDVTNI